MLTLWKKWLRRGPQVHRRQQIRFLTEQDGPSERILKQALERVFPVFPGIEHVYLVRVDYGDSSQYEVALCVRGPEDIRILQVVEEEFAKIFGSTQHLDTIFIDQDQESEVRQVAQPFFSGAVTRPAPP
jgi:hypothetical protein